jgi:hypothetical protein
LVGPFFSCSNRYDAYPLLSPDTSVLVLFIAVPKVGSYKSTDGWSVFPGLGSGTEHDLEDDKRPSKRARAKTLELAGAESHYNSRSCVGVTIR